MEITSLTPNEAAQLELGRRLEQVRKSQGLSQEMLAAKAGIGVATLRRIEDGRDAQLSSWLKLLRALDMEAAIDALLPETFRSPMAEVLPRGKRAARRSDASFSWGDEEA